jgi:hypothetical protein
MQPQALRSLLLFVVVLIGVLEASTTPPPHPAVTCAGNHCIYEAHSDDNIGHLVPGTDNVYIGSNYAARNRDWLWEHNVRHIFTMGEPVPPNHQFPGTFYKEIDVRRVTHKTIMHHVVDVHGYILRLPRSEALLMVDSGGVSDCSIFAIGHMLLSNWKLSPEEAVESLTASRGFVSPDPKYMVEIENLATTLYVYRLNETHHKQHYLGTIKEDL